MAARPDPSSGAPRAPGARAAGGDPPARAEVISLRPVEAGPLVVSGLSECMLADGTRIPIRGTVHLCRCGGSAQKPFCDGTHNRNGFTGEEPAQPAPSQAGTRRYEGRGFAVHDRRPLCASTGFCTERAPEAFVRGREPWIDPNGVDEQALKQAVELCPSGALAWSAAQEKMGRHPAAQPGLQVLRDGPFCVSGPVQFEHPRPPGDPMRFTLCRCGASANKPYCDGSHRVSGFRDES
ncbi:MAG: CDGSH iron-sulfur domain-containing protein [Pseudomonadota bacterium]